MNLELIKKYEKEFLHMLHGGNILVKCTDKLNVSHKDYLDWHCDSDVFESNLDYLIVIDDVYCTYRIALAEGKTVQYKGLSTQTWCTIQPELDHTFGVMHVSNYRIKPEEPEFKVGDWVRVTTSNNSTTTQQWEYLLNPAYTVEKWKPEPNEVCVFWDSADIGAVISKFSHMKEEKYSTDLYTWENCTPFTGILPPHMKDNK